MLESNVGLSKAMSPYFLRERQLSPPDQLATLAGKSERGPNNFDFDTRGPEPNYLVGGTPTQQEHQRDVLLALSTRAVASYATGQIPGLARLPDDSSVTNLLAKLERNGPIGTDGQEVTNTIYESQIPNATPSEAYDHFVNHPDEVFGAGGIEIRPPAQRLEDGGRYILELGGPVPSWLPVEIGLNPQENELSIFTLDGHVLRGEQTFTFESDGLGGTMLTQDAHFQASTKLVGDVQQIASVAEGQHQMWELAHREIYEQFNGGPDYAGAGTGIFNRQQLSSWAGALKQIINEPGTAADVVLDSSGEIANETIDHWSAEFGKVLDHFRIPGGEQTSAAGDVIGNRVSRGFDSAGDVAKSIIDGRFARSLIFR